MAVPREGTPIRTGVRPDTGFLSPARREALTGWLFAAPWVLGLLLFTAGPMLFSIYASFTRYNITTPPEWIGIENYRQIFGDPFFYKSLYNTFWMVVVKLPIVAIFSIAVAMLLNLDLPGERFFRSLIYMPNVLSGVAAVYLWKWILAPNGLLNRGLEVFGVRQRGLALAEQLAGVLGEIAGRPVAVHALDVTGFRDDRPAEAPPAPPPFDAGVVPAVTGRDVLLVDDVLFTGRTARAAIDAVLRCGRPRTIQLAVLVDRGHREVPIQPDYVGRVIPTKYGERVVVEVAGEPAAYLDE